MFELDGKQTFLQTKVEGSKGIHLWPRCMLMTFQSFLPMVGLLASVGSPQYWKAKEKNVRRCIYIFMYKVVAQHIHVQMGFREKM